MGALKTAYLLAYNVACAVAWGYCLVLAVAALAEGAPAAEMWRRVAPVLVPVQTAMLLEVVHAALGVVRSPVFVVLLQVGSRIMIVWGHTQWSAAAQAHWSAYLLVLSWAAVELIRYPFYACALVGGVPYALKWARYSAFIVLYPTGISGEVLQALVARGCLSQPVDRLRAIAYDDTLRRYDADVERYEAALHAEFATHDPMPQYASPSDARNAITPGTVGSAFAFQPLPAQRAEYSED
mmetsp:Transcript_33907/g.83127  ORF Transcript_33907/g.83127 Transcript_33907/m.83127 type:complete len:239 (+) Transcript_33907:67-783(+)